MMVGSIIMTVKIGDWVSKGDELGYFAFGGSTIVTLFPVSGQRKAVKFDRDLMQNSGEQLETLIKMGTRIAVRG